MESFRPISHTPPDSFFNKIKFYLRLLLDFQVLTVFIGLKKFIKNKKGKILDIGCGESPYKHLLANFEYIGIDYLEADLFGYNNKEIIKFDGINIPFQGNSIDNIICTEVLEHTQHPQELINEMNRVLKTSGECYITIPWSARYHYIPYDYYRYTPSMLSILFKKFSKIEILNRGTDITTIVSKIIIVFVRQLFPKTISQIIFFPLFLLLSPILFLLLPLGYLSLMLNLGSSNDPLGYCVKAVK
jgi:SAM-dependent methyltransferase